MRRPALAVLALAVLALAGCSGEPEPPPLSQAEREDLFWTAYEQRLGMVGKDYADPAAAKRGSIEYGYVLCDELAKGIDRDVLTQGTATYTKAEVTVQVDTAVEYLCPEQAAPAS